MPNHDLLIAEHTDALFQAHRLGTKGLLQTLHVSTLFFHGVTLLWFTYGGPVSEKEKSLNFHFILTLFMDESDFISTLLSLAQTYSFYSSLSLY